MTSGKLAKAIDDSIGPADLFIVKGQSKGQTLA